MKLTRLAVTPNGKITATIVTANDGNPPELITRPLTTDETRQVIESMEPELDRHIAS